MALKDDAANNTTKADKAYSVSSREPDVWNLRIPKVRMPKVPQYDYRGGAGRFKSGGIALLLLLSLGLGYLGGIWGSHHDDGSAATSLSSSQKIVTSQSQLINQIAKTVGPSVVSVDVVATDTSSQNSGLYSFFDQGQSQQVEDAGTGIILSSDGLIMTNRHVVPAGTTQVSVTLSDGTQLDNVSVVGRTSDSDSLDIAFLKITNAKGHKLQAAAIGDSSKVQVGDAVVAIGNALGQFQNTVTSGIISGYGRSVQAGDSSGSSANTENLDNLFQTDAAINEGNSGGPLTNMNGQVIGINTAIAGNAQNIGFAIPINDVSGLIKQVEQTGKFQRPYLGVRYIPLTADIAKQYSLNVTHGAYIPAATDPNSPPVLPDSPADKAGLQAGDIIVKADGGTIDSQHSLTSYINQHQPGDTIKLQVLRGDKTIDISATLEAMPTSSQ